MLTCFDVNRKSRYGSILCYAGGKCTVRNVMWVMYLSSSKTTCPLHFLSIFSLSMSLAHSLQYTYIKGKFLWQYFTEWMGVCEKVTYLNHHNSFAVNFGHDPLAVVSPWLERLQLHWAPFALTVIWLKLTLSFFCRSHCPWSITNNDADTVITRINDNYLIRRNGARKSINPIIFRFLSLGICKHKRYQNSRKRNQRLSLAHE